jgi:hypothetical protein
VESHLLWFWFFFGQFDDILTRAVSAYCDSCCEKIGSLPLSCFSEEDMRNMTSGAIGSELQGRGIQFIASSSRFQGN